MLQTIKQYAKERDISTQAVPQLKKLNIVTLPIYAEHEGDKIEVGKRKFVKS